MNTLIQGYRSMRPAQVWDRVVSRAFFALFIACALIAEPLFVRAAQPEFEIKLATLAPENSSLMQIFKEMNADLLKETGGKVGFRMFAGFALGDEDDVLRKLRIGMVQAAAFTTPALADINPDLRAMQVPFLFDSYEEVDFVLSRMDAELKKGFSDKGFEILGWPELGFVYFMSTTPIASVDDLKGKKVWAKANTPLSQAIIEKTGVSTVEINAQDVLMALKTNLVEVVFNSPYYALITQWNTQVKYLTDLPLSYVGGALMVDKRALARIPPPLQETLRKVCAKHMRRLIERSRKDNADAMGIILSRGVKRVTPSLEQAAGFKRLTDSAMAATDPKFLPPKALASVKAAIEEYRAKQKK